MTKNIRTFSCLRLLFWLPGLMLFVLPAHAKQIGVSTRLGSIEIQDSWKVEQISDEAIIVTSPDGDSWVQVSLAGNLPLSEYLHEQADTLHISRYVRNIDGEHLKEVGAQQGGFIQGLVPENHEVAPVLEIEDWASLDWKTVDGAPSNFLMVVAYKRGDRLYVMHAGSATASDGALTVSRVQRSWYLP